MKAACLAAVLAFAAMPALAQSEADAPQPKVVYELFTSQGCSSCPPANAEIDRLSADPEVLALSYGVTYWDYLGWKDTFARPEFTQRQRDYVRALGARNAYTPQIVINGRRHHSKASRLKAYETVSDAVSFEARGRRVEAQGRGEAVLVAYHPGRHDVPVKRGENGGRTVGVTNVVADIDEVRLPHRFTPDPGLSYALLQHGEKGEIVAAAVWSPQPD